MLFVAEMKVPVSHVEEAIYAYEQLRRDEVPGLAAQLFLLPEVLDKCWRVIALLEVQTQEALHWFSRRAAPLCEFSIKPAMDEEEALRFWRAIHGAT